MAKKRYLQYNVFLTDLAVVEAQRAINPLGQIMAPDGAAAAFEAPWTGNAMPEPGTQASWTPGPLSDGNSAFQTNVATFVRGGFLGIGETRYFWVANFHHWPGAAPDAGETPAVPITPKPLAQRRWVDGFELPLAHDSVTGEGGSGTTTRVSRDASRTVDGLGLALRGSTAARNHDTSEFEAAFVGVGAKDHWDRFYIRIRRYPDVATAFWRTLLFSPIAGGHELYVLPSGQIASYNVNSIGTAELLETSAEALELDRWYRVDLLLENNPATSYADTGDTNRGRFRFYLDGVVFMDESRPEGSAGSQNNGLGVAAAKIIRCQIGNNRSTANQLELDVDDWIGAALPTVQDAPAPWDATTAFVTNDRVLHEGHVYIATANSTNQEPPNASFWSREASSDWLNGSHVVVVHPNAFASDHAAASWNGGSTDFRSLLQLPGPNATVTFGDNRLRATASGALLSVDTDIAEQLERLGSIGVAAFTVGIFSFRASGALSGQLGYAIDGGAAVMATVTLTGSNGKWSCAMYRPSGLTEPAAISSLNLRFTKTADTNASDVRCLAAAVELLGNFAPEDFTPTPENPENGAEPIANTGHHNAPYWNSQWAQATQPPNLPVVIKSGTYVGNGTGQDLNFPWPVAWLWIRPATGDAGQAKWWTSMLGGHLAAQRGTNPQGIGYVEKEAGFVWSGTPGDPEENYRVRLSGPITQTNANGVTYQYVAFMDPGARYVLNGACSHSTNVDPAANALINPEFLPLAVMLWAESVTPNSTADFWFKGPGNVAAGATKLGSAETATALTIAEGLLTTRQASGLHAAGADFSLAYSAWRPDDGLGDPNALHVVAIGSYTGDGTASRTVQFAATVNKRPLFALVVPDNGTASIMRDPSHTGTTSTDAITGGANASTGITGGGLNQFSVGSALNANGVDYSYIVFIGSATAGNGGWSPNGEFEVVDPNPADEDDPPLCIPPFVCLDPGDEDDPDEPDPVDIPDPGDLDTDIATACVTASTFLCNQALQELGITQQIANLATEASREAASCRLVFKTTIDGVLRDFPWPFATHYAHLVRVGGADSDPVNGDWQFSYRLPTDYVFARRIVPIGGKRNLTAKLPAIPFRVGQDSDGELLYTDEPNQEEADTSTTPTTPAVGPELEYTRRVGCPAQRGDALFRQACIHRLAAALAKPLSRDSKDADRQMVLYARQINIAKTVHANEQEHQDDAGGDASWHQGR